MAPKWHFRKFKPGDALSDPDFTKALFTRDAESSLARSLVRESIQNSLDAKRDECERVEVRITVNSGPSALPSSKLSPFLAAVFDHLAADDTGLQNPPRQSETIPFLVMEDFGTHGLRGDPTQWQPQGAERNPFFLFFRALGRSGKSDEARGRWGVGKYVFPLSSRANAAFGLTVASDSGVPRLMGRMLLRTHSIGNDAFHPDGHWGIRDNIDGGLTHAVDDADAINQFREAFGLKRHGEPGLSVVVPWIRPEVTPQAIRDSVVQEYFLPLLRGQLRVQLWSNGTPALIDAETVREFAKDCDDKVLASRLILAARVCSDDAPEVMDWPQEFAWNQTSWDSTAVSPELAQQLNSQLDAGLPISIRLTTSVRLKATEEVRRGQVVVHLLGVEGLGSTRPLIIREGITLPADATRIVVDHAALIMADHGAVAAMIGDAETPAHEELQHGLIADKYSHNRKAVLFIRDAAARILAILHDSDASDDPLLLASFFPVPASAGRQVEAPSDRRPGQGPAPRPRVPRSPPRFRLDQLGGGFKIQAVPGADEPPAELAITLAYDVRRGNPFKRYDPLDFDVSQPPIELELLDAEIVQLSANRIVARPTAATFSVQAVGFDRHRDLKVRVAASFAPR